MQPSEGLFTRQLPGDRYREQTDPVLQLEAINVSFDGFQALTDLSLNIGVGELRCIIGPNGAGKTTLMDVITGKTRPKSGKAIYDQSIDLTALEPAAIARQGIGRKFQKPTVFEALTVGENLEIAMKADRSVWASLRATLSGEQRDRIRATVDEEGVADRVLLRGHVSEEELRAAYLRADVFCQPGTAELQSLVTLEALSASTPVVLADALALPHLVDEGVNGHLFPPGDHVALADRIARILDLSDADRAAMGEASHAKALHHSAQKTVDIFERLYRGATAAEVRAML